MSICKGCGKAIRWIETVLGKRMPVNVDPVESDGKMGTVLVLENGVVIRNPQAGLRGFVSHFATCPKANSFRRIGAKTTKGG